MREIVVGPRILHIALELESPTWLVLTFTMKTLELSSLMKKNVTLIKIAVNLKFYGVKLFLLKKGLCYWQYIA